MNSFLYQFFGDEIQCTTKSIYITRDIITIGKYQNDEIKGQ